MSLNSTYGTVKPSIVNIQQDVEIWYQYKTKRSSTDETFAKYRKIEDVQSLFNHAEMNGELYNDGTIMIPDRTLIGMYDLRLPVSIFGRTGIYTIYIKIRS